MCVCIYIHIHIPPWNHHHNQYSEHTHYPKSFLMFHCNLFISSNLHPHPQETTDLISVTTEFACS